MILQNKTYTPIRLVQSLTQEATYLVSGLDGQIYLLRLIRVDLEYKEKVLEESKRLKNLQHINLVQIHQIFVDSQDPTHFSLGIVMGYHSHHNSNLFPRQSNHLQNLNKLIHILMGLDYLHSKKICANLKPQKIVLSHGTSKITNYFNIKHRGKDSPNANHEYIRHRMPPEMMKNSQATLATDIWSLGMLFLQSLIESSKKQFSSKLHNNQILFQQIFNCIPNEGLKELISLMLSQQPQDRPTTASIIETLTKDQLFTLIIKQKTEGNQTMNYLYHNFQRFIFKELRQSTFNKQCELNIAIIIRQARTNNAKARFLLGRCQILGVGIKQSVEMGKKRLASALQLGQVFSAFELFQLQSNEKEKNELLMRSVKKEDVRGIFHFAKSLFQQSYKCQKFQKQAFYYLEMCKRRYYFEAYIYEWQVLKVHRLQIEYQTIFRSACDRRQIEAYLCYAQFNKYRECYQQALRYLLLYYNQIKHSQIYPKTGQVQYKIGDFFLITNQKAEAIEYYTKGKVLGNLKCMLQLSKLYIQDKNWKEAQQLIKQGISLSGKQQDQQQFYGVLKLVPQQPTDYQLYQKYCKMAAQFENANVVFVVPMSSEKSQISGVAEKSLNIMGADNEREGHGQKTKVL